MKLRSILVLALALVCAPALAQVNPGTSPLSITKGGTNANTATGARTNLGLGSIATQNSNSVTITGGAITGLPTPSSPSDAATKTYVDTLSSGLHVLAAARLATAAVLPNTPTYANGTAGVGATLTAGANSTLTVDGTVANLNDVILVKDQASAFQNGVYTVTTAGSGSAAWVLTRATYFDQSTEMLVGSYEPILSGATNATASYVLQATVTTVGTTGVVFTLFSSAIGTNTITNTNLAQMAAKTVKCNPTGSTANAQDCTAIAVNGTNVGIGTGAPAQLLDVSGPLATATVNTTPLSRLTRPITNAVKFANSVELALGSWSSSISSNTRLDMNLANGNTNNPDTTVMTWLSSGNVGIGTVAPSANFDLVGSAYFEAPGIIHVICDITGATDCASTVQSAVNTLQAANGGQINLPCGVIKINGVTISNGGIHIHGCGWEDFTGAQSSPPVPGTKGTYVLTTSSSNSAFVLACGANNTHFSDMAFRQTQPASTGGWTPTVYPPTINNAGCGTANSGMGSFIAERLLFDGIYWWMQLGANSGANNSFVGRAVIRDVYGIPFSVGIAINAASDVITIDHLHMLYIYYSSGVTQPITDYIQNNATGILTARDDNPNWSNLFFNGLHFGIRFLNLTGNAGDITSNCMINNLGLDGVQIGIQVEGNGSNCMIANVYHQSPGASPFTSGNYFMNFDPSSSNSRFVLTNARAFNYNLQAFNVAGSSNDLALTNLFTQSWNAANGGAGIVCNGAGNLTTMSGRVGTSGGNGGPVTYCAGTSFTSHIN